MRRATRAEGRGGVNEEDSSYSNTFGSHLPSRMFDSKRDTWFSQEANVSLKTLAPTL